MKRKIILLISLLSFVGITAQDIQLELFANGFNSPTDIATAGDDRLFIVEKGGIIKILNADGTTNPTPFLNISSSISTGGERGLLGLAFHPDYATNGYFFVDYTDTNGNTVIKRYTAMASDPDTADSGSAFTLLTVVQPASNHNGGCIKFGPDGYLYISMGDGGGGGDPNNNGQNTNTLLGKMLRIDVDSGSPYGIPADNPFAATEGADEVWAYGLRNAWKFSFDTLNGDIWIADVGQNEIEEINKMSSSAAGANYGWRCFEGSEPYNSNGCSIVEMYTMPFSEYTHASTGGCSITGGYVYNGSMYPSLQGKYLFSDYCHNKIGILDTDGTVTYTTAFGGNNFSTFGEDAEGELYIAGLSSGNIYKIGSTLDTDSYIANGRFNIYPNPANNVVYINPKNSTPDSTIRIYDISGKLLHRQQLEITGTTEVTVANLPTGLYTMHITNGTNSPITHKLAIE